MRAQSPHAGTLLSPSPLLSPATLSSFHEVNTAPVAVRLPSTNNAAPPISFTTALLSMLRLEPAATTTLPCTR